MLGAVTKVLILVVIVALAGWTTVAKLLGKPGDTVSEHVRKYSREYLILAVAFGFLLGHWFWPLCTPGDCR